MLERLFGSNSRVKLLKIFLLHPDKKYYIRQLSRDLKLQVNSVRRELENLERFGILISDINREEEAEPEEGESIGYIKGNITLAKPVKPQAKEKKKRAKHEKKYFQANPEFVLFSEIKALIVRAQILYERDFVNKLKKMGSIKLLILSGLFAGNQGAPVDILVVGKTNKKKTAKLVADLEKELGVEINFTVMDNQEFKYRRDITDIFLYNILEGKKIVIIDEIGLS